FRQLLSHGGYASDLARDEAEINSLVNTRHYAAVLLALDSDQHKITRELRGQHAYLPIFLITGRGKDDGIRVLEAGADDYLAKPLFGPEVVSRLRALFRRQRFDGNDVLRVHNLELNRMTGTVARAGRKIDLTHREFSLLEALMLASPEPVTKTVLLKRVW